MDRVICLVPSLTETLIEAGINVVGRTRFCIHPKDRVKDIVVVGGTKDLNWEAVRALQPTLLLVDKEENLEWMKDNAPCSVFVSHVQSIADMPGLLSQLSTQLNNHKLNEFSQIWKDIEQARVLQNWSWQQIPAQLEVLRQDFSSYENLVYVIWKNPWMRIGENTFIASVLESLGAAKHLQANATSTMLVTGAKYPQFDMQSYDLQKTFFLFSSEPFPFHKKKQELLDLNIQGAIVDGESYSWFGTRSMRFLSSYLPRITR